MCRATLFEMTAGDPTDVPSEKPKDWRKECSEILLQSVSDVILNKLV